MKIGLRGRKSGICTMSGPQIMPDAPLIMLPTPSVTITRMITGWPSSGCSSTRSITTASTTEPASATSTATGQPKCSCTVMAKNR